MIGRLPGENEPGFRRDLRLLTVYRTHLSYNLTRGVDVLTWRQRRGVACRNGR